MPSARTLQDYTHYVDVKPGFSSEVDKLLIKASKVGSCPERDKCVLILLDEMHIREQLVFDKLSTTIIGYANVREIANHLTEFEMANNDDNDDQVSSSPKLAKTMMVFMVQGLFNSLQFLYAQFPCADLNVV